MERFRVGEFHKTEEGIPMKSTIRSATLALALGGAALIMAQPAQAACTSISATSNGVARIAVTERAEAKLNRAINRWAREGNVRTVGVRGKGTVCAPGQLAPRSCTASAYVCR